MKNILKKADCVIIKNPSNLYYFSKYNNQDAVIIYADAKKYYLTDARYLQEANENLNDFIIIDINRDLFGALFEIINENKYINIGIEDDLPYNFYNKLISGLAQCNFVDVSKEINYKKSIKTDEEIELIKAAQQITDKTFSDILPLIKEGITEIELGHILYNLLIENGADGMAFESIIAFGRNSAKPHALKTNTKLRKNQFIKMDFGAKYKGYSSDMTRTIAFGSVTSKEADIYQKVKSAQQIAIDNLRVGLSCKEAYNFANNYFKEFNLQKYFLHSLGHGLGTDVHQTPALSPKSDEILEENMVVTVEPGLYLADQFGVRIEDIIVFKKLGVENLTKSQKQMIIL